MPAFSGGAWPRDSDPPGCRGRGGLLPGQQLGQRADRGVLEQLGDPDLPAQSFLETQVEADHVERIPPEVEEVVVEADVLDLEHLAPERREPLLERALRLHGAGR